MKQAIVVDNHPVILEYMRGVLQQQGYEVHVAEDGLQALSVLSETDPSVIFVDLIMPNIDGRSLCRLIRGMPRLKDAYVVVLSAVAAEEHVDVAEFGAHACIAKGPFSTLSGHVIRALDEADRYREGSGPRPIYGLDDIFRRHITEELLSSRRHLQVILENMRDGMLEITEAGQIVYANTAALRIIGKPEPQVLGKRFLELFRPEEKGRLGTLLEDLRSARAPVSELPRVVMSDHQVALQFCPVADADQQSTIVLMVDVEERDQLHTQLRRAFRMESVAALAGGIAHEFNNALCEISGIVALLESEAKKIDDSLVAPLRSTIRRMTELTDQLLSYGGKRAPQVSRFDLSRFLRLNLPVISHALGPEATIEISIPDDELFIRGDGTQIQMALSAIITNAVEATDGPSSIKVEASTRDIDEEESFQAPEAESGRWVVVTVEDTGCGMSGDVRERVFEPFFSTKSVGRGLGMTVAYGIAHHHGGWMTIESGVGEGTRVRMYLPPSEG